MTAVHTRRIYITDAQNRNLQGDYNHDSYTGTQYRKNRTYRHHDGPIGQGLSDEENTYYEELNTRCNVIDKELKDFQKTADRRAELKTADADLKRTVNPLHGYHGTGNMEQRIGPKSWCETRASEIPGYQRRAEELPPEDWFRCLINKDYGPLASYRPESRGAILGAGVSGGFLAPERITSSVIDQMIAKQGIFARVAKEYVTPGAGDTLSAITMENCEVNQHGLYGFSRPTFVAEGAAIPEGEARFVKTTWTLKKLPVSTRFSIEIGAVIPDISRKLSEAMSLALNWGIEQQILNAAGSGIINHASTLPIGRTAANTITFGDVVLMESKTRLQNPLWIASQSVLPQLAAAVDIGNHAVFLSALSGTAGSAPVPSNLLGHPILYTMGIQPKLGSKGDIILASDLSYFKCVIFQDLIVQTSESAHWSTGEIGLRVFMLLDMHPLPFNVITPNPDDLTESYGWATTLLA
jgi:HK97 family phage major capsid protein